MKECEPQKDYYDYSKIQELDLAKLKEELGGEGFDRCQVDGLIDFIQNHPESIRSVFQQYATISSDLKDDKDFCGRLLSPSIENHIRMFQPAGHTEPLGQNRFIDFKLCQRGGEILLKTMGKRL